MAQTGGGDITLLTAPISWQAGQWHLISLGYGPSATRLMIDNQMKVAHGWGTLEISPDVVELALGSSLSGNNPADGDFDELFAFNVPLTAMQVNFYYMTTSNTVALGPVSPEGRTGRNSQWAAWLSAPRGGGSGGTNASPDGSPSLEPSYALERALAANHIPCDQPDQPDRSWNRGGH